MDRFGEDLLKDLECVICYEYMLPPITLCKNGHLICPNCKPLLKRCHTCRGRLTDIRNRTIEKLSYRITHPCKYQKFGCTLQFLVDFKQEHEITCTFTPHKCPAFTLFNEDCLWLGALSDMKEHVENSDHFVYNTNGANSFRAIGPLQDNNYHLGFFFMYEEVFLCLTRTFDNVITTTVMFLGSPEDAENYSYQVSVTNKDTGNSIATFLNCQSYLDFLEIPLAFYDFRSAPAPLYSCPKCSLYGNDDVVTLFVEVFKGIES